MPEIRVKGSEKAILCENGANLLQTLLKEGFFVDNPCNGNGTCGKCKVRILSGDEPGIRLSCLVEVTEDLEVEILGTERKERCSLPAMFRNLKRNSGTDTELRWISVRQRRRWIW